MAIILRGMTCCPLCDEVVNDSDAIVATSHFVADLFNHFWKYSDAAMHERCFLKWDRREEFVQLFNETMATIEFGEQGHHQMQVDGEIVTVQPKVSSALGTQDRRRLAIHDAAETRSAEEIMRLLHDNPAQINVPDGMGITPLHLAVAYQGVEEANTLIKLGADMSALTDTGHTEDHLYQGISRCCCDGGCVRRRNAPCRTVACFWKGQ